MALPKESLWKLASRPLAVAAALLAAAAALAWGAGERQLQAQREAIDAGAQLQQAQADLTEAQDARLRLEANLRQYDALRAAGFVGVPDRVALLGALEEAARGLAGVPVRWEMAAALPVEVVNDPKNAQPLAQVSVVPMKVRADHVHEIEWLALLGRLRGSARGQMRLEGCTFQSSLLQAGARDAPAVRADCTVAWVHIVPVGPAGAAR